MGYKDFVEHVKSVRGYVVVPLDGFGLMDDENPPAVRCLQQGNWDWMDHEFDKYRGVPILSGKPKDVKDWDPEEQEQFLVFLKKIALKSVRASRHLDEEGKEHWLPMRLTEDEKYEEPVTEDGVIVMPSRVLDINDNLTNIGLAVLWDSNFGGQMADAPAGIFRAGGADPDGPSREEDGASPARDHVQPQGRSG